ncbi:MAG: hypothetical protein PF961_18970 [Planctomycetota bacterium]|nr:hypothetical protein [Planctomycetota bacterium]
MRSANNPLITPASGAIGTNINGPSVIAVPDWVKQPLGKYYMYFAHHGGDFIRLAYADHPAGPWTVHGDEVLPLAAVKTAGYTGHLASPDVHVDHRAKRIVMFFHAPHKWPSAEAKGRLRTNFKQLTGVASSADGLDFAAGGSVPLAFSYLRVFVWRGQLFGLTARGLVFRWDGAAWPDGTATMIERAEPVASWRHCAVHIDGDRLYVFYSRWGDKPERIVVSYADLKRDWNQWQLSPPVAVLRPEGPLEGADLPVKPSAKGAAKKRLHELRDPAYFEAEGRAWLYYSIAGESGISVAHLAADWKEQVVAAVKAKQVDLPD